MKKTNVLQIVLELIVILGSLIVGTTILICHFLNVSITKTLIGLIIVSISTIGISEFLTLKIETKLKSILSLVFYICGDILGLILLLLNINGHALCIIWGIFTILFATVRITTSFFNLLKQPLLNIMRIITKTVAIVFGIILIVNTLEFAKTFFVFIGIILLIEGIVLLIEFIIHRFQN